MKSARRRPLKNIRNDRTVSPVPGKLKKPYQQEGPSTSLEAICRKKQPVVKLFRLETPLDDKDKKSLSKLDFEQCSDQNALLPLNTECTKKHAHQKHGSQTICLKIPVVQLTRLNIETKNQVKRHSDKGDREYYHNDVQPADGAPLNVQSDNREEQMDDSDSDQSDVQNLDNLSAYELERLKNIKANQTFLKSLKLCKVASTQRHKRVYVKREKLERRQNSVRLEAIKSSLKILHLSDKKVLEPSQQPKFPFHSVSMIPTRIRDYDDWITIRDTWKSISTKKFTTPTYFECTHLTSYANSLNSLRLEKRTVTVPGLVVSAIAIHPSDTYTLVAAGDLRGNVVLCDQKQGSHSFPLHSGVTNAVAFSPYNSKHLLSLGSEGSIFFGDVSYSVFDEIYKVDEELSSFDFLSSSVLLVSHVNSKLSVVDCRTWTKTYNLCGCVDLQKVRSVSVHPLKRDLCLVAGNSNALIYDVRKLTKPVMTLLEDSSCLLSASFSPGTGKHVLTCSSDKCIRVFRIEDSKQNLYSLSRIHKVSPRCFAPVVWDPKEDNYFIEGFSSTGQINFFHATGQYVGSLSSSIRVPTVIAVHPTTSMVAAGTCSGKLYMWKE